MMQTCFFIGHRDTPDTIFPALVEAVDRHITVYGVTDFVAGRYGRFDALAAQAVRTAKKRHPSVTLTLLVPYYSPDRSAAALPSGFDGSFYPPGMETVPKRFAIVRANRYLVGHCSFLIAYAWRPAGSAWELLKYAQTQQTKGLIQIENLAKPMRRNAP